jgi:hypothetical protein
MDDIKEPLVTELKAQPVARKRLDQINAGEKSVDKAFKETRPVLPHASFLDAIKKVAGDLRKLQGDLYELQTLIPNDPDYLLLRAKVSLWRQELDKTELRDNIAALTALYAKASSLSTQPSTG